MLDAIFHRGPDGEGRLSLPDLGFQGGMRRLSIIDLAGGDQPIWNEDKSVAVLFNGEIYNYRELRAELEAAGHRFATASDTEVLVHLYEEHGIGMLSRLRGMFGIALVDLRRKRLLLARDPFGQKSVYYHQDAVAGLSFCSELKGLLELPHLDRKPSRDALREFAAFLVLPPPSTHFKGVFKLRAGHFLDVDLSNPAAALEPVSYRSAEKSGLTITSMKEAVEVVDRQLADSVALHLRSDVPVGILLSSGLDSRLLASYAAEAYEGRLKAFTIGFGEGRSEVEDGAATARLLGIEHFGWEMDAARFLSLLPKALRHLDEPIGDAAAVPLLEICTVARKEVKVLLGGEGADELFAGYAERYQGRKSTVERTEQIRWAHALARLVPHPRARALVERTGLSRGAEVISLVQSGQGLSRGTGGGFDKADRDRLSRRFEEIAGELFEEEDHRVPELLGLDQRWELPEWLLQKSDKMSMAASLELRSPFLDPALADVAALIDPQLNLGETGLGKQVLRAVHDQRIGEGSSRPKKGFPLPLNQWLRNDLREELEPWFRDGSSPLASALDPVAISRLWDEYQTGAHSNGTLVFALWAYCLWHSQLA